MKTATAAMLAADFHVARSTIWRWWKTDPTFPAPVVLGGTTTRWLQEEIDAWVLSQRQGATDEIR